MEKEEGELCRTVVVAFDVTFSQWESRFNSCVYTLCVCAYVDSKGYFYCIDKDQQYVHNIK